MAGSLPTRLSASEGRKFGLTVGLAFLILAAVAFWRGRSTAAEVLSSIGGVLLFGGILAPRHLGPVQRAWMGLAHAISKVTTPIVMGVIYFVILSPVALVRRATGHNRLVRKAGAPDLVAGSYWIQREAERRRSNLERQF